MNKECVLHVRQLSAAMLICSAVTVSGLAQAGSKEDGSAWVVNANDLGSLTSDLVYTPITPCRIVDTRNMAAGPLQANTAKSFSAFGIGSYFAQGGTSADCGLGALTSVSAVALNVTVVSPASQGYLTVFPYGATKPTAASMVFTTGSLLSNGVIVKTPNPAQTLDFTVFPSTQTEVVIDIVGHFSPPVSTALSCYVTFAQGYTVAPGAQNGGAAPACVTGYTPTATYCYGVSKMALTKQDETGCTGYNLDSSSAVLWASQRCCRLPGR